MGDSTAIAWTDHTANFWIGCVKVSDGCKNCYAETLVKQRMGAHLWGPAKTTQRRGTSTIYANVRKWERAAANEALHPLAGAIYQSVSGNVADLPPLGSVAGVRGRRLVFVGSLMDWAEDHPDADAVRPQMWAAIRAAPHLHFQLLTKRAERIGQLLPPDWGDGYPNVWLGTSIEDMRVARRADALRDLPAVVRFISYEPALGPLDDLDLRGLDWIIYGGESGKGYREHDLAWPRAMRARCAAAGVTFFYKQSAAPRTEMGIKLDGEIVRAFPTPRVPLDRTLAVYDGLDL